MGEKIEGVRDRRGEEEGFEYASDARRVLRNLGKSAAGKEVWAASACRK